MNIVENSFFLECAKKNIAICNELSIKTTSFFCNKFFFYCSSCTFSNKVMTKILDRHYYVRCDIRLEGKCVILLQEYQEKWKKDDDELRRHNQPAILLTMCEEVWNRTNDEKGGRSSLLPDEQPHWETFSAIAAPGLVRLWLSGKEHPLLRSK